MAEFVKPKELFENNDTVVIQPLTKEGIDTFSIWSVDESKFYREDDELTIGDTTKKVSEWKFTKMTDEQKSKFRRNAKVNWNVLIGGTEFVYPMPPTVAEKLRNTMDTVTKMDKDPLSFTYSIVRKKTGSNAWDVEYEVVLGGQAEQQAVPEPQIDIGIDVAVDDTVELTEQEHKVVEAIKKQVPDFATRTVTQLVNVFVKNDVPSERAEKIVNSFLR